ncbi:MAG: adenylosuccinate synthetase, partial [Candidatus Woesearchaeota archaeon]
MSIDLSTIQRIEELDFKSKKRYEISSFEERILPLIKEYQILAIGGAFFGDEGKGKLVDILAQYVDFIARLNSGENAGHSVYFNGKEYVFHLAPSGLFIPGKQNLINSECVLDPITFLEELQPLKDDRTGYLNNLIVGNVHLVTPYHKLLDFLFN